MANFSDSAVGRIIMILGKEEVEEGKNDAQ